jgi:glucose-6-phosphate-specific signal transduction histidine kinase
METSSIVLLAVSAVISFGIGRTIKRMRDKKREKEAELREAQTLRDRPAERESKNRSKRRRQLQQQEKKGGGQAR